MLTFVAVTVVTSRDWFLITSETNFKIWWKAYKKKNSFTISNHKFVYKISPTQPLTKNRRYSHKIQKKQSRLNDSSEMDGRNFREMTP